MFSEPHLIRNLAPTSKFLNMKIALFGKTFSGERSPFFHLMFDSLRRAGATISMFGPYYEQVKQYVSLPEDLTLFYNYRDLQADTDVFFSIGGDGTLLDALPLIRDFNIPVLGINMGRLGFLSSVSKQEIGAAMEAIISGNYTLEERSLLQLTNPDKLFPDINYALNEVTVFRKETTSLIVIQVFVDDIFLNAYWADGLIVATPTGSTAYSLSAGGPIMVPSLKGFVITPIATHNLSVRPVVIPDNSIIRLKVVGRHEQYTLSMDSRTAVVDQSEEITIRKAGFTIRLVQMKGKDFFGTIREKLLWGLDIRN